MDNDDEFNFSTQRPPGESEEKDQFGEPGDDDFPEDYPTLKQQMKFTPAESTILFEEEERRIMEEVMRGGIESTENVDNADLDESALLRQGSLADETISAEYEEPGDSILEETIAADLTFKVCTFKDHALRAVKLNYASSHTII